MTTQRHVFGIALGIAALAFLSALGGCKPAKPSSVPRDSVYVVGGKVGWWQHCSFDPKQDVDHCQIFNSGGESLYDEVFLPYDGGKAAEEAELRIVVNSDLAGPQYVCLRNGRTLIPRSQFEQQKRFIDWATGKSAER